MLPLVYVVLDKYGLGFCLYKQFESLKSVAYSHIILKSIRKEKKVSG
jgi:hypothetical protein